MSSRLEIPRLQPAQLKRPADGLAESPLELPAGEIDSHPDARKPGVLPGPVLQAGSLEDPFAHGNDQTVLFGDRNEFGGQQQTQLRMPPAQQRLSRDYRAGVRVDDGLIVHLELVSVQCAAQVVLQRQPLERGCSHGLGVGLVAVPALLLSLVHGGIGVHEQGVEILPIEGIDGDADARVDEDLMGADPNRMGEAADDAPGELRGVLGVVQPRHDHGELVTTETRHFRSQAWPTQAPPRPPARDSRSADVTRRGAGADRPPHGRACH